MFGNNPPERSGIGRSDRLAFIEYGRRPDDQRCIDNVGMPNDPADIRRRPEHVAGLDAVNCAHRPSHRNEMSAIVTNDAFGLSRCPGSVEDIERISCRYFGARN